MIPYHAYKLSESKISVPFYFELWAGKDKLCIIYYIKNSHTIMSFSATVDF